MNDQRSRMLISFAISVAFWYMFSQSLELAVGMLLLVFVHEMGHFVAARLLGLRVSLPTFSPMGGAVQIQSAANVSQEAFVAMAGPLVGGLVSIALMLLAPVLASNQLMTLGYWGVVINLLNLVPLEPLDGGKISLAIDRRLWVLGVPLFLYFLYKIGLDGFNLFIGAFVLFEAWNMIQLRAQQARLAPSFFRVSPGGRALNIVAYLALAGLLTWAALNPVSLLALSVRLGL